MLRDAAAALIPFTDATLQLLFILSKTFLLHSLVCRGALFIISLLFFSLFFRPCSHGSNVLFRMYMCERVHLMSLYF